MTAKKETPEEILEQIKSLDVELELIQGVEMKTESTEFDQLEDFVNDVGIFHEVLESGRFERQIVRLEKNDISMSFRFYKNKFRDWHVINKGSLLTKGKTKRKDKYWNTVDESKRNNTTRISPANRAWQIANQERREVDKADLLDRELNDDGSWDAHQCHVERCEFCERINCVCDDSEYYQ